MSERSKKIRQNKIIREGVLSGKSGRAIQIDLRVHGIGIRSKTLYQEIRSIKGEAGYKPERKKYTPKKYKKKITKQERLKEIESIYRMSFIIRDIPLHSIKLRRNYLGFRLTAFSINKNYLLQNEKHLKDILVKETNKYCYKYYSLKNIFENYNWTHRIFIENPTEIIMNNAKRLNNTWVFIVEKEGVEQYRVDGDF